MRIKEVKIGLTKKADYDLEAMKEAIAKQGFPDVELVAGPS